MASSTVADRRSEFRRDLRWVVGGLLSGVVLMALLMAVIAYVLWSISPERSARATALCGQAVSTMLDGRDPVDLQRADMILRHLDCRVRRRVAALP